MNSNRNLTTVIFAVLALLLAVLAPQALRAEDEGCSNSTLNGSYRNTGGGTVVGVGPFANINLDDFDGSGNGQAFGQTRSVNGNISTPPPATATYTVNADCTGTAIFGGAAHFNIVVDRHGAGFFNIRADPGFVTTGQAVRLGGDDDQVCSVSTLRGSYRASTFVGSTVVGVGPIAVVNNLDLDGSGNGQVTQSTHSVNGVISVGTATVTYTVDDDCSGSATFTPPSGPAAHFNIVVDKKGAGFFYISTDSGKVVSGQVIRLDTDHEGE